jgi:hypothetical protein
MCNGVLRKRARWSHEPHNVAISNGPHRSKAQRILGRQVTRDNQRSLREGARGEPKCSDRGVRRGKTTSADERSRSRMTVALVLGEIRTPSRNLELVLYPPHVIRANEILEKPGFHPTRCDGRSGFRRGFALPSSAANQNSFCNKRLCANSKVPDFAASASRLLDLEQHLSAFTG